jgi:hypothetical protein
MLALSSRRIVASPARMRRTNRATVFCLATLNERRGSTALVAFHSIRVLVALVFDNRF